MDELYNHNVKLYCTAEAKLDELFVVSKGEEEIFDEAFAFDRTKSRLTEMQSEYYIKTKEHKYYKLDDDVEMNKEISKEELII